MEIPRKMEAHRAWIRYWSPTPAIYIIVKVLSEISIPSLRHKSIKIWRRSRRRWRPCWEISKKLYCKRKRINLQQSRKSAGNPTTAQRLPKWGSKIPHSRRRKETRCREWAKESPTSILIAKGSLKESASRWWAIFQTKSNQWSPTPTTKRSISTVYPNWLSSHPPRMLSIKGGDPIKLRTKIIGSCQQFRSLWSNSSANVGRSCN